MWALRGGSGSGAEEVVPKCTRCGRRGGRAIPTKSSQRIAAASCSKSASNSLRRLSTSTASSRSRLPEGKDWKGGGEGKDWRAKGWKDCKDCKDSKGCKDCKDSKGCKDCKGCKGCKDCKGCKGCKGCKDCKDCKDWWL